MKKEFIVFGSAVTVLLSVIVIASERIGYARGYFAAVNDIQGASECKIRPSRKDKREIMREMRKRR